MGRQSNISVRLGLGRSGVRFQAWEMTFGPTFCVGIRGGMREGVAGRAALRAVANFGAHHRIFLSASDRFS